MNRRSFLKTVAAAGAVSATGAALRPRLSGAVQTLPANAADLEIVLQPQQAGAVISPQLYGHFIEHLGGVIYDGIWVGRDSKIPNIDGIRRQFVDDYRRVFAAAPA